LPHRPRGATGGIFSEGHPLALSLLACLLLSPLPCLAQNGPFAIGVYSFANKDMAGVVREEFVIGGKCF
jgi:hypothetical protein